MTVEVQAYDGAVEMWESAKVEVPTKDRSRLRESMEHLAFKARRSMQVWWERLLLALDLEPAGLIKKPERERETMDRIFDIEKELRWIYAHERGGLREFHGVFIPPIADKSGVSYRDSSRAYLKMSRNSHIRDKIEFINHYIQDSWAIWRLCDFYSNDSSSGSARADLRKFIHGIRYKTTIAVTDEVWRLFVNCEDPG